MKNYFEVENVEVVELMSYKFKKCTLTVIDLLQLQRRMIKWQLQLKVQ